MKTIIKFTLLIITIYIVYSAYLDGQVNGKSIWFNIGKEVKSVADYGIEKAKQITGDLKNGLTK